ncbi:MAG: hypothetical protein QW673_01420 [Candidatus Thermoplasmatota archaeon]
MKILKFIILLGDSAFCDIKNNFIVHHCNIWKNRRYGIYNFNSEENYRVNARFNWWDSITGPWLIFPSIKAFLPFLRMAQVEKIR